jgi:hypothetical protein
MNKLIKKLFNEFKMQIAKEWEADKKVWSKPKFQVFLRKMTLTLGLLAIIKLIAPENPFLPVDLVYPYNAIALYIYEPSDSFVDSYDPDPFTFTSKNTNLHLVGRLETPLKDYGINDHGMPTWGDPMIKIHVNIDGQEMKEISIPREQQDFQTNIDLKGVEPGNHIVEVYFTHRADWRTWKSDLKKFTINFINDEENATSQVILPESPVLTTLKKINDSNIYLIAGFAPPNSQVRISGAKFRYRVEDFDRDSTFEVYPSTISPMPTTGIWGGYIKIVNNEPVILKTVFISSGQESKLPVVIYPENINKIISKLNPPKSDIKLSITTKKIRKEFTTRLTTDNPLLAFILRDKTSVPDFFLVTVGRFTLNNRDISDLFEGAIPDIVINDNGVAYVTAVTPYWSTGEIQPFGITNIDIGLDSQYDLAIGSINSLEIAIKDYDVLSVTPLPVSIENNVYKWINLGPQQKINLQLSQKLSTQLGSFSQLSIYDFTGDHYTLAQSYGLIMDFVVAFPVFFLLVLVNHLVPEKDKTIRSKRIKSIVYSAGILFFLPSVWSLLENASFDISQHWPSVVDDFAAYLNYTYSIQYSIFNQTSSMRWIGLGLSLSVCLLFGYLGWFFEKLSDLAHSIFSVLSRASFWAFVIFTGSVAANMYLEYRATENSMHISNSSDYYRLMSIYYSQVSLVFKGVLVIIFAAAGLSLQFNIFRLIAVGYYSGEPPRRVWIISSFTRLLIILLAIGVALYNPALSTPKLRDYWDYFYDFRYGLQILSDGAIMFTAFAAIYISYLAGQDRNWIKSGELNNKQEGHNSVFQPEWLGKEYFWLMLGWIMFAGYVIGTRDTVLSIPISAISALIIFPWILIPQEQMALLSNLFERIHDSRKQLISQLAAELFLRNMLSKSKQIEFNLANGKVSFAEYEKQKVEIEDEVNEAKKKLLIKDLPARNYAFMLGPDGAPIENGFLGARWGFLFQLPLLLILFNLSVIDRTNYPWLYLIVGLFTFVMRYTLMGFFFGLFYEYIRGNNGLRKALTLTLATILATLPYYILSSGNNASALQSYLLQLSVITLFWLTLGILFDLATLKRNDFEFSYLRIVTSDMTSLVYLSSFSVTTVTVVITSVLTGQLSQILTGILTNILPALSSFTNVPFPK